MKENRYIFSAPTVVNIELTDKCNMKCMHCYNYWREDNSSCVSMSIMEMDRLVDILVENKVFHAILSGGEPFVNFEVLEYGIKKLRENNISFSCNSNLVLATEDKIKRLRDAGVDHILTSLNSFDPEINDEMVQMKGALKRIVKGIELAVHSGIRISANMIISQRNRDHVYQTGLLAHNLGCQKIFGTRVVPSVNVSDVSQSDYALEKADVHYILDQLVRVKEETGIMIGTLVSYPLCVLENLEKYVDFVGRGCPGQSGHFMNINVNGQTHACVHEKDGHGNIFEIGLKQAYQNMKPWYDLSYRFTGCEGCPYIDICSSGCRMASHAYTGFYNQKDPLMVDKNSFTRHFNIVRDESIYEKIEKGLTFFVPDRLRFREENGFFLVNIRWANTVITSSEVGEFLMKYKASGREFGLRDFKPGNKELLAKLFFKDVIESRHATYHDSRHFLGLGIDLI